MLSSQAYGESYAPIGERNTLYTKHLLNGLKGTRPNAQGGVNIPGSVDENGNITPESLHRYILHKVSTEADQIPKIKMDRATEIILSHSEDKARNKGPGVFAIPGRILRSVMQASPGMGVTSRFQNDYIFENLHIFSAQNVIHGKSRCNIGLVTVGGVEREHQAIQHLDIIELNNKVEYIDDKSYTTSVCALLASPLTQNNFIGISPYSRILLYDCSTGRGTSTNAEIGKAIMTTANKKPHLIFLPLGSPEPDNFLRDGIKYAISQGITVIAPAGNGGSKEPSYPSSFEGVLSGASIEADERRSAFSNYHESVDICAYGSSILTAISNNQWQILTGTTYSVLFCSGSHCSDVYCKSSSDSTRDP